MQTPRAIVFDWDNTLVDSWGPIHEALVVTLSAMGHEPWTLAETKARVRHSLRDAFPALFGARWDEARRLYLDSYAAIHLERLTPLTGSVELLDELAASGRYYLAVLSNKTGATLRLEAEHLGWSHYFKRLVGAGDAGADKPDPVAMALALDGSGIPAGQDVWYIGDTAVDMECAARAGCVSVLLGVADLSEAGFASYPPGLNFPGCAPFGTHLKGL